MDVLHVTPKTRDSMERDLEKLTSKGSAPSRSVSPRTNNIYDIRPTKTAGM